MKNTRVNEIDLLRFLAALAVVFFHLAFRGHAADDLSVLSYPWLEPVAKYGYLGVDLFFMISGFVILMTAQQGSLRAFVVSRLVRLYPAFWVCCTFTFLCTLAWGGARFQVTWPQYLVNMTMLSEFMGVPPVDGVYWSLFVELRFYALVALVLVLGAIRHAQWLAAGWLATCIALEFVPVRGLPTLLISDYAAYFVAGATCYLIWQRGWSWARGGMVLGAWALALHQSLHRMADLAQHYHVDMDARIVGGLVTAGFATLVAVACRATGALRHKRWAALGALTYPLYLLHQNISFMAFNHLATAFDVHLLFWGVIGACVALAHGVHRYPESWIARAMKAVLQPQR